MDTINFIKALNDLKDSDCIRANVEKVEEECSKIESSCSDEQASNVEIETRLQAKTPLWNILRSGRITASNAKASVSTNSESPAQSLIKKHMLSRKFQDNETSATNYGLDNEMKSWDKFMGAMCNYRENLSVEESGCRISTDFPYFGASLDDVVTCDCCRNACLEIKCPYSAREIDVNPKTCKYLLEKDGQIQLI